MKDLSGKLGARIKEVRKARHLTQERLAEQAEISPRYLSRLEVGEQSPSIETLAKLAVALKVEVWELFDFSHAGTVRELRATFRRLAQELEEDKLRVAVKVLRAVVR